MPMLAGSAAAAVLFCAAGSYQGEEERNFWGDLFMPEQLAESGVSSSETFVSIVDVVQKLHAAQPDKPVLRFLPDGDPAHEIVWDYTRLTTRAKAVAAAIGSTGKGDGCPVLLMLPPGLEFISSFFGCLYARAIAVPMTPPGLARMARTFSRLARIVNDSGAKIIITDTRLMKAVEELRARMDMPEDMSIINFDEVDDRLAADWKYLPLSPDTPGWLQYTSGSTSDPKGVIVTHGNIIANWQSICSGMKLPDGVIFMSWLPPFHDMGLVGGIITPILCGGECITMPPMAFLRSPFAWLRACSHYHAYLTGAPNFAYDSCCERITDAQLKELDLSSVRGCYCGSEPIRLKTVKRFLERFAGTGLSREVFYPCYGLAENTLFSSGTWIGRGEYAVCLDREQYAAGRIVTVPEDNPNAWPLVTCGREVKNTEIRIVNPDTRLAEGEDEIGEIWLRGACVAAGYWHKKKETEESLKAVLADTGEGGWLRTGDLGFMHRGSLYVSGRRKEMIIVNGRNFFPQDMEESVTQNVPGLEKNGAAAFGVETGKGEGLVAVFETKLPPEKREAALTAIRTTLTEEFDVLPHAVVLVKRHGVPKTTSGKIQQAVCRKMYLAGELPVLAMWQEKESAAGAEKWGMTPPPEAEAGETLRQNWEAWLMRGLVSRLGLGTDAVTPHTPFSSMGMNSSTAVSLTGELQQILGRQLSPTLFYDCADVSELAAFLSGESAGKNGAKAAKCEPMAIIGLACRLPGADSPEELTKMLFAGTDAISGRRIGGKTCFGGFVKDPAAFDAALFGISPREAGEIDPQQRMLLEVSWEALERAGIAPDSLRSSMTGVFTGISGTDFENLRLSSAVPLNAYVGTGTAHSIAANRLSWFYGLRGPSMAVDSACSSSLLALHTACRSLQNGECDLALVCGVNLLASPVGNDVLDDAHLMAPDGRCKTFSADANGYVRSEGCVVLVLKKLDEAERNGDRILGVVRGSAVNQDGRTSGLTAPSRHAQAALLKSALDAAGLSPSDIDAIEAHGTGTALGDPIEFGAINDVYAGSHTAGSPLIVSSVKTSIGHLEACAGLAGVCRALVSFAAESIPPTLHFTKLNPAIDVTAVPSAIPVKAAPWPRTEGHPRLAGVSSFGFGGTNVHVILGEPPLPAERSVDASKELSVFTLSAASADQLQKLALSCAGRLRDADGELFTDLCLTSCLGRAAMPYRLAVFDRQAMHSAPGCAPDGYFTGRVPEGTPARRVVLVLTDGVPAVPEAAVFASRAGEIAAGVPGRFREVSAARRLCMMAAQMLAWKDFTGQPAGILYTPVMAPAAALATGLIGFDDALALAAGEKVTPKIHHPETAAYSIADGEALTDTALLRGAAAKTPTPDNNALSVLAKEKFGDAEILVLAAGEDGGKPGILYTHGASGRSIAGKVLAALWTRGAAVSWPAVYRLSRGRRVLLPTYPFRRTRYWFADRSDEPVQTTVLAARRAPSPDMTVSAAEVMRPEGKDSSPSFSGEELLDFLENAAGEILRLPEGRLDPKTPLVRAGFDSLMLMELAQRTRRRLGRSLAPALFLEAKDLADLADHIAVAPADRTKEAVIVPAPQDRFKPFPLTDVQHAYWLGRGEEMPLGGVSCCAYAELDFRNPDLTRLEKALNKTIARHDMLRCVFTDDGRQRVLEEVPPCHIVVEDVSGLGAEEKKKALEAKTNGLSHEVLPLDRAPVLAIRATRLDAETVRLHIKMDMLIADAFSFGILLKDIAGWYAFPETEKPALTLSFRDCVLAEEAARKSPRFEADRAYWMARIPSLPGGPELPLAADPQTMHRPRFTRRMAEMPAEKWSRLKDLARARGLTPSAMLLSAFSLILSRWCAKPRFCLMLTTFDRGQGHPEISEIVGDFTKLLLLEVNREKGASFADHAEAVSSRLRSDLGHGLFSAMDVLRELSGGRSTSHSAVVFTSALPLGSEDLFSPSYDMDVRAGYSVSQTPQVWLDHQVCEYRGKLIYTWDCVEALFPDGMMDAMFETYGAFLEKLSDPSFWDRAVPLAELPAGQEAARRAANDTAVERVPETIQAAFLRQAGADGSLPAVMAGDRVFSRSEIVNIAKGIASGLVKAGFREGEIAAVMMEKSWEQIAAAMAILLAGGTYLPADPSLPDKRLIFMMKEAEVRFCLVRPGEESRAERVGCSAVPVTEGAARNADSAELPGPVDPDMPAYVIYTSGSTGTPKGVVIQHAACDNTLADLRERFSLSASDRVLALASLSFDLSVFDAFGVTGAGGAIVMPAPDELQDPAAWCRLMKKRGVTVWNTTPALMQLLLDYLDEHGEDIPEQLRLAILSGDRIPLSMPGRMRAAWPGITVAAMGGATEASIWSNLQKVTSVPESWHSIPYGRPLSNQGYLVLDEDMSPCPDWVTGDLYITGRGLARGYLNNPGLTEKSFFRHPVTGERLYRTGDLGRYWPDGTLEFMGRSDSQVKVNGFRVELEEIESAMRRCPGVKNAAAAVVSGREGSRLVGFAAMEGADETPAETPEEYAARSRAMREAGITLIDETDRLTFKQAGHNLRQDLSSLPRVSMGSDGDRTGELFSRRISSRRFLSVPVPGTAFPALIRSLMGLSVPEWPTVRHRYGSAGWTYAVQAYVIIRPGRVEGFPDGGAFYYHPLENALVRLGPCPEDAADAFPSHNREIFESSAFAIILAADMDAIRPVYGNRSDDFVLIEAGLMSQLLEETAMPNSLGLCQIGAVDYGRFADVFRLGPSHRCLHCLIGGAVERGKNWKFTDAMYESLGENAPGSGTADPEKIRGLLSQWLPGYMVPHTILTLPAIPLTSNGKVDRRKLVSLAEAGVKAAVFTPPEGEGETKLAALAEKVLGRENIGALDNFFDLGATSLQLVLFQRRVSEMLSKPVAITDIFAHPNIRDLAAFLFGKTDSTDEALTDAGARGARRRMKRRAARRAAGSDSTGQNVDKQ